MILLAWALFALQDLPGVPEGWKLELIANAPELSHPSVVCCAPDGRIFVAEDPMDISAPADRPLGRILCLHPGGPVTVYADKLYAVFGMQYLDGRLHVLHNPKYTRFRDDGGGVGLDRTDLITQTNPKPWAHDWNDHVPANFKLGLDGMFYVAVGDKGVFGAVGPDGSKAELRGGGILRMTPDAGRLEIYSTGVRNILDVAINADGDIFTYDNTDEHNWMGRLTHMVDGGFYGYPYDFHPRRPYTLWMMADFGGGAATGALCYEEDAWPSEWRGNLILADFGKRSVARVRLAREGASYAVVSREEIVRNGPGKDNFRPVGLTISPDGRSLYICDWNHGDTKAKIAAGRLFKVTPPGAAGSRPSWWAAAASGRPFEATDLDLLEALTHPAWSVRMTAQRRLVDRKAVNPLRVLLADPKASPRARVHALWALAALDGLPAAIDSSLARHAVRAGKHDPATALQDPDPMVRFEAATALGRRREFSPALREILKDPDALVRYAAFTALARIGAWDATVPGLRDPDPRVREGTLFSLRSAFAMTVIDALSAQLRDPLAVEILSGLVRKEPAWDGAWWSNPYHPALAPRPRPTVDWEGTPRALEALRAALDSPIAPVRKAAVDALTRAEDRESLARLRAAFAGEKDLDVRRSILAMIAEFKDTHSSDVVKAAFGEPALAASAAKVAEKLKLVEPLIGLMAKGDLDARRAAIEALGALSAVEAVPALVEAFALEETRFEAADALSRVPDVRALGAYGWGLASANAALRERCEKAVARLRKSHPAEVAKLPPPPARSEPQRWFEHGISNRGDVERGRLLFEDTKGVACAKCHRVKGKGGEIGPDLSTVGSQFSRAELAESVLWPSRRIREGYGQVRVRTKGGDVISGAVKEETAEVLSLMDAEGRRHAIRKADIDARQAGEASLMPDGLERGLTPVQFSDLLEYLQFLK